MRAMTWSEEPCPCGTGRAASGCCAPLLAGARATTAEALMRSRFTAFARSELDYLVQTHLPDDGEAPSAEELASSCRRTRWTTLRILATEAGGPSDAVGVVEFEAGGVADGEPFLQRERSRFRRVGGAWRYVGGEAAPAELPGRNGACPCGSGKKFKRCHGR